MPTILSTNLDFISPKKHNKKFIFKRKHCDVNLNKFNKKRLSEIKWQEVLDNNDVNDDNDKFIERFNLCSPEGFSQTYFPKGGCCNPPSGLSILKVI